MTIPIIIINWNGYDDTTGCIQSVLKSSHEDFKIILLDNGSDNAEGLRLQKDWEEVDRVEVRLLPENLGFARANNLILMELLQSDCIEVVLLNNDTEVDVNWLEILLSSKRNAKAGMASSKFLNYYAREYIDNLGHQMLNTGEVVPIGHGELADNYTSTFENFGSCAGAALYDIDMLKDIGLFDDFFSTGYEDAELGVRAVVSGYTSIYAPQAIAYHKMGQSIKKIFNRDYALMIQTSIWYAYFKLMPWGVILISLPFLLIKIILLTILNVVFLRFNFLRIQWLAIFRIVGKYGGLVLEKRRIFLNKQKTISSLRILKKQRFFLWFDLNRFYKIFIRRRSSALDSYGGE